MNQNDVVQGDNLTLSEVITGKQAPDPAHEYGTVSPPPSSPDQSYRNEDEVPQPNVEIELKTAPGDWRFPVQNQTRHCYTRYLEYHRCIKEKGKDDPACEKFARYYRSLCPLEWIQRWNEQVEQGTFPGPI
ncbi:cytochrome c oxidase subunit 6b-3-like [Spinacia oleracea]|uniref:Cytochrome c oxidase subunit 6b-3-like n=1 Tax=Spinacia oleracea TaxID=3562 RepID=A0A9R0I243_SPIOL|nr:cytochrome c oxidase subunit 6b-3-like [Spinacia oleracea]